MAQVAISADEYAISRQNIFFKTIYASLEGQCVTLTKCFMEDMTSVPNPHAARGDAKLVGKTLVAQGHAVEVPFSERKRGDLICYEYGTYGHIATQLSGGRVFEQNVNMGGVQSKIVDGERVYASRIGSENESWRVGKNPHIYRLKSYKEGNIMADFEVLQQMSHSILGRRVPVTREWYDNQSAEKNQELRTVVLNWTASDEAKAFRNKAWDYDRLAKEFADYKKANPVGGSVYVPVGELYVKKG